MHFIVARLGIIHVHYEDGTLTYYFKLIGCLSGVILVSDDIVTSKGNCASWSIVLYVKSTTMQCGLYPIS